MINSKSLIATRSRRRASAAVLCVVTVSAIVACDSRGSGLLGTGGTFVPNASLKALTVSAGTLTPAFDSATISYSAAVPTTTTSVTVTPTAAETGAVITVSGAFVPSGTASLGQPLIVGSNTILINVTSADGVTVRTYAVVVLRAAT